MSDLKRVHMIGIGGAGMSGLARILLARGSQVTGSDVKNSTPVEVLRAAGANIAVGHAAENLELVGGPPTCVVTSFAAIPQDNPELVAAREKGIEVIRRSDLLAELMQGHKQILLAGTHGKTSTTSLTVSALQAAGKDPSFAIGGQLNRAGTNAHHGTGKAFVAEADESDASLLRYEPDVAVVTNIEPDHLDYFGSPEAYFQVFEDFADRLIPNGVLVVCLEDEHASQLGENARNRGLQVVGYGSGDIAKRLGPNIPLGCEIRSEEVSGVGTQVTVRLHTAGANEELTYAVRTPGHHMVLNSAAALLAGTIAGAEPGKLARGITEFGGVRRRFDYHGTIENGPAKGARVYDDYAHHPTEVRTVLAAAREMVESEGRGGKIVVCFQPHLYSRTIEFAEEFAQALSLADAAVVLDIFGAREKPVEGVTSRVITEKILEDTDVVFEPNFSEAPSTVARFVGANDVVLTVGAGSVTMLADEIVDVLSDSDKSAGGER